MEFFVVCLLLLCIAAICFWTFRSGNMSEHLPPSPKGLPFVGHLHLLGALPHQAMSSMAQKYGGLMMLKLGSVPTVVVSTADVARELLTTHDLAFASRPKLTGPKLLSYGWKDIAWSRYGSYWRQMRKLSTLELFTVKRLEESASIRRDEVHFLLKSISQKSSQNTLIDFNVELGTFTMNVILRMAFSTRSMDPKFFPSVQQFIERMGSLFLGDYFPSLWFLDHLLGSVCRLKRNLKDIDEVVQNIIHQHKSGLPKEHPDLLDLMLSATEVDDDSVKGIVMDMITAGTDTASLTAEWALSELLCKPELMKKAREEIDHVVGKRLVNESDLPKLHYLKTVVKETFRLHPVLPLLLPRESSQQVYVQEYRIPSNTRVIINAWAIGRDPAVYGPTALEFDPDRFVGSEIDFKGRNFELIPFGGGRRVCPGLSLGLCMLELMVALMVQTFEWEPEGKLDMEEVAGVTMRRKISLKAFAKPRIALPSYQ